MSPRLPARRLLAPYLLLAGLLTALVAGLDYYPPPGRQTLFQIVIWLRTNRESDLT